MSLLSAAPDATDSLGENPFQRHRPESVLVDILGDESPLELISPIAGHLARFVRQADVLRFGHEGHPPIFKKGEYRIAADVVDGESPPALCSAMARASAANLLLVSSRRAGVRRRPRGFAVPAEMFARPPDFRRRKARAILHRYGKNNRKRLKRINRIRLGRDFHAHEVLVLRGGNNKRHFLADEFLAVDLGRGGGNGQVSRALGVSR